MRKQIKKTIDAILSILLPNYCEVCGSVIHGNTKNICLTCINNKIPFIDKDNYKRCNKCFRILNDYNICECEKEEIYYNKVSSLFYYREPLINLIHLMKFYKRFSLCYEFGFMMSYYRANYIIENNLIIPIPLGRKRLFERGYNQSKIIANVISKKFNIEIIDNAVIRKKETKALSRMNSVKERKHEISSAFSINKKYIDIIKDKNILIIDDVFTTGATCNEIAKVLKENKAKSVNILTLAHVN